MSDILDCKDIMISIVDDCNYSDIPLLTALEEKELFKLYMSDNLKISKMAYEKIFYSNIRLVKMLANKYGHLNVLSSDDLFMEGCIGLIVAIKRFNVSKDRKFSTYATWWVRQFMFYALKKQSDVIRVPIRFLDKVNIYKNAINEYKNGSFNLSFLDFLEKNKNISENDVVLIEQYLSEIVSLDAPLSDEDDTLLSEVVSNYINVEDIVYDRIESASFINLIDKIIGDVKLSERDRKIIYYRFGLHDYPVKSLDEIGLIYNLSHQRVCKIVRGFIDKIKNKESYINKIRVYSKKR